MTKSEKIAQINAKLTADIAAVKAQKEQTIADYYAKVAELQRAACEAKNTATDDEQQEQQDCDQPTQWLNGEQWTAAVVARRILNKLPRLNYPQESFYIEILPSHSGGTNLDIKYVNTIDKEKGLCSCELSAKEEPEIQAARVDLWLKSVDVLMAKAKTLKEAGGKDTSALDDVIGMDAVGELNDIMDGVCRKEGSDE